jgi:ABC-type Fe3+/spermidine/putrescine transport system ATPase subunit
MRLERLVIEAGNDSFTLDLHPRLTVVADMGRAERESLIGEIIGALGGSRSGVHAELEERSGRHLAVFRPSTGRHRVIDVDRARDVTASLCDDEGQCDLLEHLGLTAATARRAMRVTPGDLATSSDRGRAVEVLAGLDQRRVWAAAEALQSAEGDLATEALALGSAPEDAALIDDVEERHAAVERAAELVEATRRRTFVISGLSTVAALPAIRLAGVAGLGLIGIAAVSVLASWIARNRLLKATAAEDRALAQAGAQSYLGFQLQRVNCLIGDDRGRRALMGAAGQRRSALAEWQQLAGDIPVDWAIENRGEIETAARLRRDVEALAALSTGAEASASIDGLARGLIARLAEARSIAGEGVPLLLDDPFEHLDDGVKIELLELLGRSAGDPQIVLLTEDETVAGWARLEAIAGGLALIEPAAEHEEIELRSITL